MRSTAADTTPGPGGYLVAVAVSVVTFAAIGAAIEVTTVVGDVADFFGAWAFFALFGSFYAGPFAVAGVLLVHFSCRRVPYQWVHVLAAGAAGLLPVLTFAAFGAGWDALGAMYVPVATAIGRWSVVPLVPVVRRRRTAAVSPAARAAS